MSIYYEYIFQSLAFVCGLMAWRHVRPLYLKWIILLLGITVLNEIGIVPYLLRHSPNKRDVAYNIFSLMDMGAWLYVFYRIHAGRKIRKWIIPATIIIYLYSFIEMFLKGWTRLHIDSFRVYEITILILSCSYLYGLIKKEYHVLMFDSLFWVCAAGIIYHSVLFLNLSTLPELNYWLFKNAVEVFNYLQIIGNIFYYLFLSFAFISCISFRSNKTDSYQE